MQYCPSCQRMVATQKKFSWPAFIAWFILGVGWGALVYLAYYAMKPKDKCTNCEATTLSSPPPGFVLNPNTNSQFVPQEVVWQQQQLHQQQNLMARAPPTAGGYVPGQGVQHALPTTTTEAWANVANLGQTICPSCNLKFNVEKHRPLQVTCPMCGATGTLPGAASGGASSAW